MAVEYQKIRCRRTSSQTGQPCKNWAIKGAEVQVFERAMDRAVTVLATIARLNIDERLAKISEQQAALVREALNRALADAGVPREQQRETVTHLARHLRVVAG